jgi:hypothetical protein
VGHKVFIEVANDTSGVAGSLSLQLGQQGTASRGIAGVAVDVAYKKPFSCHLNTIPRQVEGLVTLVWPQWDKIDTVEHEDGELTFMRNVQRVAKGSCLGTEGILGTKPNASLLEAQKVGLLHSKKQQDLHRVPESRAHVPRNDTKGRPWVVNFRMADLEDQ